MTDIRISVLLREWASRLETTALPVDVIAAEARTLADTAEQQEQAAALGDDGGASLEGSGEAERPSGVTVESEQPADTADSGGSSDDNSRD